MPVPGSDVAAMNSGAVVFALANRDPEIDPIQAQAHVAVWQRGGRISSIRSTLCSPPRGSSGDYLTHRPPR